MSDLRDYVPESFRIPQPRMEEKLLGRPSDREIGLRKIHGLTFYEAMDNNLTVRLVVCAACIMAGILLGLLV